MIKAFALICIIAIGVIFSYLIVSSEKNLKAEMRKLRHDIKNHIDVLNSLISSKEYQKAQDYMLKIDDHFLNQSFITPNVGNALINAILLQKTIEYPAISLKHHGAAENTIKIDDYDLYGFTAIDFYIYQEASTLLINIRNDTNEQINLKQFGKSSSKSGINHGYGINNVKETIKKYNGVLQYTQEQNHLTAKIILYL